MSTDFLVNAYFIGNTGSDGAKAGEPAIATTITLTDSNMDGLIVEESADLIEGEPVETLKDESTMELTNGLVVIGWYLELELPSGDKDIYFVPTDGTVPEDSVIAEDVDKNGDQEGDVDDLTPVTPPGSDGIVSGTHQDDLIDVDYTGDPDGDRIDAGDAILPGAKPNDDFVLADAGDDTVFAGLGDDEVYGGSGRDSLVGETGNDSLFGEQGDDTLEGGNGRDFLDGGSEDDVLSGGNGRDTLIGGSGDDTLDGGNGRDSLEGGAGEDSLIGGRGKDTLRGGDDNDTLRGGQGNDQLFGDKGEDSIDGGAGNDTADGGAGDDTLDGAGGGNDSLSGGDDRDLFVNVGAGDWVDGNEGGDDCDTLDLRGSAGNGRGEITFTSADQEDGFVTYFDENDNEVGRLDFFEIEKIIPICFTPGTLIATPDGERPIEDLRAGDRVITRDNGIQEICWAGSRGLTGTELESNPHLKPVHLAKGSLGNGLPERDMWLSPNHRVLVANDQTALYFEEREVLVAAKHLTALEGISISSPRWATYIHIMFEQHEVILSNGSWTESFQPGDYSLNGIGNAQRLEIQSLFPELETPVGRASYQAARKSLKRYEAQLLTKA